MDYFKRDLKDYHTTISPIPNYMEQAIKFVCKIKNVDAKTARLIIKKAVSKKKFKDPIVEYRGREDNGDRSMKTTTLSNYISSTLKNKDTLVPSFTVYDHPDKKKSLHADFLSGNIKKRNFHKAAAFEAHQNGDQEAYINNNVLQKVMKIFNNSFSGAYASNSTIVYNPSQHYTLTSITRSIASIGNSVTESLVAGNKCLYTPNSVMEHITACITIPNMNTIAMAIKHYNISIPTVDNVFDMLRYSSDRYWTNKKAHNDIYTYLKTLNNVELSSVMYVNDLYHMRKYNDLLVKDLLFNLSKRVTVGSNNPLKDMSIDLEGINNLVHHICMDDIRGMKVKYSELAKTNPDVLMILGSTANNIYTVLNKYRLLFKAFFITDVIPINTANIKDACRDVIVLSDTDSTCGSYDNWVHWYYGHSRFTQEAVGLSAAVMTINTQIMDHNIRVFAKNMNIDTERISLLKMKNEYFFGQFVTANISKHYYASVDIQEGNVYAKPKLEIKGVNLIASSGNQDIVKSAHEDMRRFLECAKNDEKISAKEILTKVANIERKILEAIDLGDISMFRYDKIKLAESYKDPDKSKSPYFHHMLWKEVFLDTYGDPGEPTYMTLKIPVSLGSKKKLADYIATIDNKEIADKLKKCLEKYKKNALGTFRVPLTITGKIGIPPEILGAVDKYRVVLDNVSIYYILLETLGIFRSPKMLFSEMGH